MKSIGQCLQTQTIYKSKFEKNKIVEVNIPNNLWNIENHFQNFLKIRLFYKAIEECSYSESYNSFMF